MKDRSPLGETQRIPEAHFGFSTGAALSCGSHRGRCLDIPRGFVNHEVA